MSSHVSNNVTRCNRTSLRSCDVQVAVIGCGGWGQNLVRNFSEVGALSAIVDANAETAKTFARKFNSHTRDLDTVLADPAIDAVVIAAPAAQHYELANRSLLA